MTPVGDHSTTASVCPECRVAKHDNCDGGAWDFDTDTPTVCRCAAENHGRDPASRAVAS
jgi:hypothetical protein